jgi:hypothetical protein
MACGTHSLGQSTFRTWTVRIGIGERDGRTYATAHLHTDEETELSGAGTTYLDPRDHADSRVGDDLAVARALFDLAHILVQRAATDVAETLRSQGCGHLR